MEPENWNESGGGVQTTLRPVKTRAIQVGGPSVYKMYKPWPVETTQSVLSDQKMIIIL